MWKQRKRSFNLNTYLKLSPNVNNLGEIPKYLRKQYPAHGGAEPGAVYNGRQEKDDTLRLALAVGELLAEDGVTVLYTRFDDTYHSPIEKATIANNSGADYFLSIHRNAMPQPNSASGIMSLVYRNTGTPALMAENINEKLREVGFQDLGVIERPGLVVLRRTQMPAVLVEAGYIDNDQDNLFFDQNFDAIARAIADGVLETIQEEDKNIQKYYQVQVGAYRPRQMAESMLYQLQSQGFPAFLVYEDDYYKVRVGAFVNLNYAIQMENDLRQAGYSTFITQRERV